MSARIGIVWNKAAGDGKHRAGAQELERLFGPFSRSLDIRIAGSGREIELAVRDLLAKGCDVIVAAGGDGTVGAVATLLIDGEAQLGVLPLGTLNHFARDLGIPLDLSAAAEMIARRRVVRVDAAEVNGCVFVNNSSLGLYPGIVRIRERAERSGTRRLRAFAAATLLMFRRYPFLSLTLRIDGTEYARRSPFLFVGNNQYDLEGMRPGRRARLNEGLLSVAAAHRTGRIGLLRLAFSALFRRLRRNHDFAILPAHEVWIETRHRHIAVALDGEVVRMKPPLHYRIRAGALRVIGP